MPNFGVVASAIRISYTSPGSAIYARNYFEVNAVFLLICILHTMSFNIQEILLENPWHKVTKA